MLKRFHTVFIKLVSSYAVLVILLSASIGMVSYGFFSNILEDEISTNNEEMVRRTAESLRQQIFEQVERIWMETAVSNEQIARFTETPELTTSVEHFNICQELQRLCRVNSGYLYAMDIYMKEANMVISSSQGIKYLREGEWGPAEEFRDIVEKGTAANKWIGPREIPNDGDNNPENAGKKYITLIRTIPYIRSENIPLKGYLAIKVREEAVTELIRSSIEDQKCEMMVVDQQGTLMSHSDPEQLTADISQEPYFHSVVNSAEPFRFITAKEDGDRAIISAVDLGSGGLTLVRKLSFSEFYHKIGVLRWIVSLICLVLGAAMLGVSVFFVRDIYTPLKNIVKNLRFFMDAPDERQEGNEYRLINRTLTNLSDKVNSLKGTLAENMPVIRNSIVEELLTSQEQNRRSLQNRLKVCNIAFEGDSYIALAVTVSPEVAQEMDASFLEYYRFDLIRYLQTLGGGDRRIYAASMRDPIVGVIVNAQSPDKKCLEELVRRIADYARDRHEVEPVIGLGSWTEEIENISLSYSRAPQCLRYAFLLPEKRVLAIDQLTERERSSAQLPPAVFRKYHAAVKSGNLEEAAAAVRKLVAQMREQPYAYQVCQRAMNEMVSFFAGYLLEKNLDMRELYKQNLYAEQEQLGDIFAFQDWLIERIAVFFDYLNQNKRVETSALVDSAVKYIETHLDQDISLSSVAEKLYITAPYLSKLFKEEMGINFNGFVTQKRLELARELVLNTNASVNDITQKVGFNSSTYLIKKFKEAFGDTPVNYKKTIMIHGGPSEGQEAEE